MFCSRRPLSPYRRRLSRSRSPFRLPNYNAPRFQANPNPTRFQANTNLPPFQAEENSELQRFKVLRSSRDQLMLPMPPTRWPPQRASRILPQERGAYRYATNNNYEEKVCHDYLKGCRFGSRCRYTFSSL